MAPAKIDWIDENKPAPKESTEILYVIGLNRAKRFFSLQSWLEEKSERRIVFIEEEISHYVALKQETFGKEILDHPQVEISTDDAEALARKYPTPHIAIEGEGGEELMRETFLAHAFASEEVYAPVLFRNLKQNFSRWSASILSENFSGKFAGVPAVICGAGPSLAEATKELKEMGEKGVIFACGSAIPALSFAGVEPHFSIAFDPNETEVQRLAQGGEFCGLLLYASRLHPDVFARACYAPIYVRSGTGGAVERWVEEEVDLPKSFPLEKLGKEALSVTTSAIALAVDFGCSPIILCGVDLSIENGERYAPGVEAEKSDDRALLFELEVQAISDFAKKHPETKFYRGTTEGRKISGVTPKPLRDIPIPQKDLRGKIHRILATSEKMQSPQKVLDQLFASRDRSASLLEKLMKTTSPGMRTLLEKDLKNEEAYALFIALAEPWVESHLMREGISTEKIEQEKLDFFRQALIAL